MGDLVATQKISYELVADRKTGKAAADQLKIVEAQSRTTDRPRQPGNPIMAPDQALTTTKPTDAEPRLDQREATQKGLDTMDQDAEDTTPANLRPEY